MALFLYKLNVAAVSLFLPSFYYFYVIDFLGGGKRAKYIGVGIIVTSVFLVVSSFASSWIIAGVT